MGSVEGTPTPLGRQVNCFEVFYFICEYDETGDS